jgi:phage terminase large subunit GpA-like protein
VTVSAIDHLAELRAPFRLAATPPTDMVPSVWADTHRILSQQSAEPGPWRTDRTPYLREPMDSIGDPDVERICFMASTQVGKTEWLLNCIGYAIDQDPGPTMLVMPRDEDRDYMGSMRVQPMLNDSPALAAHLTPWAWDVNRRYISFDRMTLYYASAQSPAGLASRPIRYLFCDEVDKYPQFAGKEAGPLDLARERTRTFFNRKQCVSSTPTTKEGTIYREWQKSDQRRYWVPCPHCRAFQVLNFACIVLPEGQRDARRIREDKLATYHCGECGAQIEDRNRPAMLAAGVWVPDGGAVAPDGTITGVRMDSRYRGYHINCLYSPWLTWSDIAGEWVAAQGDTESLYHFVTSWLGEPWEERVAQIEPEHLSSLARDYPANTVPEDALVLTAGVDVQADQLYYTIRAWGEHGASWLVRGGRVYTWASLVDDVVKATFSGRQVQVACIDSGYRTDEVYDLCRDFPDVLRPVKGEDHGILFRGSKIERHPRSGSVLPASMLLWLLNVDLLKDKLARQIGSGVWLVHKETTEEYLRHVASEHKVVVRQGKAKAAASVWRKRPGYRANHWLDCEVYALAAVEMVGALDGRVRPRSSTPMAAAAPPAPVHQVAQPGGWMRRALAGGRRGGTWNRRWR